MTGWNDDVRRLRDRRIVVGLGLALAMSGSAIAQDERKGSPGQGEEAKKAEEGGTASASTAAGGTSAPAPIDVKELLSNPARHGTGTVAVAGEVHDKWGSSFVLESGGLFDDEVLVVVPRSAKGIDLPNIPEDADVIVTGTLRRTPVMEIEREIGWDLDPEIEVELDKVRPVLVASAIRRQTD